jgi:molecular chaperone DnaK (HSP70)
MANLRGVAEAAKIKLSSEERVVIRMPVGGGIEAVLTRPMFEKMTKGLFRKARLPLDQACWQVRLRSDVAGWLAGWLVGWLVVWLACEASQSGWAP